MTPSLLRSTFAAIAVLLCGVTLHAQNWTVVNLHPPGATRSEINALSGTQQAGYATIGYEQHAALWSGSAASFTDIHHPAATFSIITALSGNRQAGYAFIGGQFHAALWSGNAGSFVDLHPAEPPPHSFISATTSTQQVGYTLDSGQTQAALWSGTPDSFVNLHPAGASESAITALSGNQQAGFVVAGGQSRATIWSGTPASYTNLHPPIATHSYLYATNGTRQGGSATIGGQNHAGLWSGTAGSFVDLHPPGITSSEIHALSGNRQAGYVVFGDRNYAALWSGSIASFVDLHAFLPAGYLSSRAYSIWTDGFTVLVGGFAYNSSADRSEAILWRYTPPRAPTLSIKGKKRIETSRPSLIVKGRTADIDRNLAKVEVKVGKAKFKRAKGLANWRFTAKLRPGKNPVTARATDSTGLRSRNAKITILRR